MYLTEPVSFLLFFFLIGRLYRYHKKIVTVKIDKKFVLTFFFCFSSKKINFDSLVANLLDLKYCVVI